MTRSLTPAAALLAGLMLLAPAPADEPTPAERGKAHLLGQAYNPPTITAGAYERVWTQWGLKEKPAPDDYARLFRERYGFHPAPYPNGVYPMGLGAAAHSWRPHRCKSRSTASSGPRPRLRFRWSRKLPQEWWLWWPRRRRSAWTRGRARLSA